MRFALLLGLVACGGHEARDKPVMVKEVDQLKDSDRDTLIHVRGRVADIVPRQHVRFTLEHGGRRLTVVDKGSAPELLRDGVDAEVEGRWVHAADVRAELDKAGFSDVHDPDVFLSRGIVVTIPH